MAEFDQMYRMQQAMNNPMLNVQQLSIDMPNWLRAPQPTNPLQGTPLLLNQMNRAGEMQMRQDRLDMERERARQLADIQMQTFQAKQAQLAQQQQARAAQQAELIRQQQAKEALAQQIEDPVQQAAVRAGYGQQVVPSLVDQDRPKVYNVGGRLVNELGAVVYEPEGGAGPLETKDRIQLANTLRDDFRADTKSFDVISNYWDSFKSAGDTGVGDVTRIFAYMKMIDPTSTVREGEAATLENAGGVPAGIVRLYNRVVGGGSLSPQIREQLISEAGNIYNSRLESYQDAAERYRGIAGNYGISREEVVPEKEYEKYVVGDGDEGQTPPPPPGFVKD